MGELIDLIAVYLAMAVGFAAVWWGIFRGLGVEASIIQALVCGAAALALGMIGKAVWFLATWLGGSRERKEKEDESIDEGETL